MKVLNLFQALKKAYGEKYLWTEVVSVYDSLGVVYDEKEFYQPFKNLVIGVLSQNTSDANSARAYIGLTKKFEITPQVLADAPIGKLREAIRAGGLYNLKSKRIKQLSREILKRFEGNLSALTKLPREKAREELLSLSGIGPKTADIWLTYCSEHQMMAVDTNVNRVAKRLGVAPKAASYNRIKEELEKIFAPRQRLKGHEYLVRLGRDYCKPKNPLCSGCPIEKLCKKNI